MPSPKPPPKNLLAAAADLRAGGVSGDAVAAHAGRAAETVRKWAGRLPG